ncbi:MAG: hypothetical protein WCL24_06820 [Verrucomicrobiota bacterium]
MLTRPRRALFLLAVLLLTAGCESLARGLARGAAEEPYRKALLEGRMTPADFQRKQQEIRAAAEPSK